MPKVEVKGKIKHFPYTETGIAAAKAAPDQLPLSKRPQTMDQLPLRIRKQRMPTEGGYMKRK